jgi:hypothetical protein
VVKATADALFLAYRADRAAADQKYTDRVVEVSGMTGKVQKEGGRYIIGAVRARVDKRTKESLPRFFLYVHKDDVKGFAGLDGNRPYTIRGRCKGATADAGAVPEFFVVFEDCIFVSQGQP